MSIRVEFYGIPRQRAGVAATTANSGPLADVIEDLALRFPKLAETCFSENGLAAGYVANLRGDRFLTNPQTNIAAGETLIILSADAGG